MNVTAAERYRTLEEMLVGKSEAELKAIAEAEATAEAAKTAYRIVYMELLMRRLPNVRNDPWRSLPIAGENGLPLSAAAVTHDDRGLPQPRQAITRDEAHFLSHDEKLFMRAQVAVIAYNQLLEAPPIAR